MSASTNDPTLAVLVPLPSELARTIDALAKELGRDRAQVIVQILQEQLDGSDSSFAKMIAPIAEDFRRSGMTEEDLDALVAQERRSIRHASTLGL